ncbi:MAG: DUF6340 family protein [Rikenellaceae bacterium]
MKLRQLKATVMALSGVLMLTSCGPVVQLFDVDVRVPAKHPLDLAEKSIAVFSKISEGNDSLLMVNLAAAFSASIEKELSYKEGSVPAYNILTDSSDTWDIGYIQSLSRRSDSDILMIINKIEVSKPEVCKSDLILSTGNFRDSYIMVPFTSLVDVYDGISAEKLTSISQTDTLLWEILSRNDLRETTIAPKIYKSLLEATKSIAENLSGNFFDQWESVQRYLYIYENAKWHKAYELSMDFKWAEAMDIWLDEVGSSDKLKSACAAFNLAIACEMKSRRDLALEWIEYARSCYPLKGIDDYKSILQR